jgi:hypothetical protein
MRGRVSLLPLVIAWVLLSAGGPQAADRTELDAVSVHLFLRKSGTFSPDVTTMRNFHAWNFEPSGDGMPEGEEFDGVLVKVRMRSDKEVFARGEQARLRIRSLENGKVIRTERLADVFIGPAGVTHQAFYVPGIACTPIEIVVTAKAKSIRKTLKFNCGE